MPLDLAAFVATRVETPPADVPELLDANPAAEQAWLYADGFCIHREGGAFLVHAWWYAPIAYGTLEEAEAKLYPWYLEFAD